jgi:four helix bundle protein
VNTRTLIDLQVYQKALVASFAVSTLLKHSGLRKDFKLSEQLRDAAESVSTNIAEGFGQRDEHGFVMYLFIARGSANELRSHLLTAHRQNYITTQELEEISRTYVEIGKMLTLFIRNSR